MKFYRVQEVRRRKKFLSSTDSRKTGVGSCTGIKDKVGLRSSKLERAVDVLALSTVIVGKEEEDVSSSTNSRKTGEGSCKPLWEIKMKKL